MAIRAGIVSCAILLAPAALAAEWTRSASVTPSALYTDNVCLSATNEKQAWVALVTPALNLRGEGRRADVNVRGAVELNSLSESRLRELGCAPRDVGGRGQISPRIFADANTLLVEDWLNLGVFGSIQQSQINPYRATGGDSLNRTGNLSTQYNYGFTPTLKHRFKDVGNLLMSYSWDKQYNSENAVGDSEREHMRMIWASGPVTAPFSYALQGDYDTVSYAQTRGRPEYESDLGSVALTLGYQLNRRWQVNGTVGEEFNDYVSAQVEVDGTYWDAGVRWTPNVRTLVEVGSGEHFYGSSPRLAIRYRHKRSVFRASYDKSLTYDRNIRAYDSLGGAGNGPDGAQFPPGQETVDVPEEPILGGGDEFFGDEVTTLTNSPILNERFRLQYAFRGRRTAIRVAATHSLQLRTEDQEEDKFVSALLNASRELSSSTRVSATLGWRQSDPQTQDETAFRFASDTWRLRLGLQRDLNAHLTGSVDYQYTDRQSDGERDDYTENRITLRLNYKI
jgi:uncharacterized protein (PEP-CTERM system associated)